MFSDISDSKWKHAAWSIFFKFSFNLENSPRSPKLILTRVKTGEIQEGIVSIILKVPYTATKHQHYSLCQYRICVSNLPWNYTQRHYLYSWPCFKSELEWMRIHWENRTLTFPLPIQNKTSLGYTNILPSTPTLSKMTNRHFLCNQHSPFTHAYTQSTQQWQGYEVNNTAVTSSHSACSRKNLCVPMYPL